MINLEKESGDYARKMWGEYFDNTYDESCNMLSYGEVCQKDFKAGLEFEQRWIPVEEEEPKNREKLLIKWINEDSEIKSCGSLVLDSPLGKYWQSGAATQLKVTHWRPFERS